MSLAIACLAAALVALGAGACHIHFSNTRLSTLPDGPEKGLLFFVGAFSVIFISGMVFLTSLRGREVALGIVAVAGLFDLYVLAGVLRVWRFHRETARHTRSRIRSTRRVNAHLELTEYEIPLPGLREELDGFTIAHLSDLHLASDGANGRVEQALAAVMASKPDLIALTGDFVCDPGAPVAVEVLLKTLDAPCGVYAVRGNHDFWDGPEAVAAALDRAGVRLLSNATHVIDGSGVRLRVAGIEHPFLPFPDPVRLLEREPHAPTILLSHVPDNFERLDLSGFDLVLSGHTHGGQFRAPVIGPVFVPSALGRKYDHGLFETRHGRLFVNRGLGGCFDLRINSPAEIALLILRRKPQKAIGGEGPAWHTAPTRSAGAH